MSDHYPIVRGDDGNVFHSMVFIEIDKCIHLVTLNDCRNFQNAFSYWFIESVGICFNEVN